jgi:DNA polymerase
VDQLTEHLRFYQELGVTGVSRDAKWRRRSSGADDAQALVPENAGSGPPAVDPGVTAGSELTEVAIPLTLSRSAADALASLRDDIGDCTRCKLHALGRKQVVFGVGNASADLMFVGEAPGADEDTQGIPFVGRAGQLLTKMIEAMGMSRQEVYIANVLKCRPPDNRNPEPDEIATCEPFLFRQVASIEPKVVIALGAFAARTLLRTQDPISKLRGRVFDFRGAKLIPTFHPSFLLRSPGYKREAWEDLKKALTLLGRELPASRQAAAPE